MYACLLIVDYCIAWILIVPLPRFEMALIDELVSWFMPTSYLILLTFYLVSLAKQIFRINLS